MQRLWTRGPQETRQSPLLLCHLGVESTPPTQMSFCLSLPVELGQIPVLVL